MRRHRLALRLDGLDDTAQVFGVLSDGDCQEGQTWEAATAAAHFGVPNLTAIVDYNHLQTDGTTEEVMDTGDVRAKFEAFGWDAVEIDGHDMDAIVEALERSRTLDRPAAIVCQTTQGPGRLARWRAASASTASRRARSRPSEALEELEATLEEQTEALQTARRRDDADDAGRSQDRADRDPRRPTATRCSSSARRTRRSSPSTPTSPVSTQSMKFGKRFPERFFNCGAAEANMMSMACGLAATGKVPYASTFAIFATGPRLRPGPARHRPQRAQGADRRLARRRLAGRGRRLAPDDRGHRADAGDAADAGRRAGRLQPGLPRGDRVATSRDGPDVPALRPPVDADRLRRDPGDARQRGRRAARGQGHLDLRLRPHGLAGARGGRALAREDGVEAEVVNVAIVKPLDSEAVLDSLAKTGVAVTAEEHRVAGGLADAVREVAAEQHPVPIFAVGMGDEFGISGTADA